MTRKLVNFGGLEMWENVSSDDDTGNVLESTDRDVGGGGYDYNKFPECCFFCTVLPCLI